MLDKKSILRNFKKAVKSDAKRMRKNAELASDMKSFKGDTWSQKPHLKGIENCKHESVIGIYPFICCGECGKAMEKKPHYKWSWKENKAVKLWR